MPTYDYKCLECNHKFELFQPMTSEPISICPECGGKVKRLIGAGAGPIFKGSGFYQTDYKNNSPDSGRNNGNGKSKTTNAPVPKDTKAKSESKK